MAGAVRFLIFWVESGRLATGISNVLPTRESYDNRVILHREKMQ